jgi:hypothetical protein
MSAAPERVASAFANSSITMQEDRKVCSAPPNLLGISMPMKPFVNMALSTAGSIFMSLSIRCALGARTSFANLAALSRIAASSALRAVQMPGGRLENDAACGWRQRERLAAAQRNRERGSIDSADQSGVYVRVRLKRPLNNNNTQGKSGAKRMPPLLGGSIFEQTGCWFVNM